MTRTYRGKLYSLLSYLFLLKISHILVRYLLKSVDSSWSDGIIALEAGKLCNLALLLAYHTHSFHRFWIRYTEKDFREK